MARATGKYELDSRLVTVGGRRVMLLKPHWRAYGHTAMEMQIGLHMAAMAGASAYFVRPRQPVAAPALYELQSTTVPIVHPGRFRPYWDLLWWDVVVGNFVDRWVDRVKRKRYGAMQLLFRGQSKLPRWLGNYAERQVTLEKQKVAEHKLRLGQQTYYRRTLLREPIAVELRPEVSQRTEAIARQVGIAPDARIVTLHVREPGFKLGREVQDQKEQTRDDSVRNGDVRKVFPAMDHLVSQGYTVVRMGDASMTPVERPGVIDIATSPLRVPELDVWCLLKSEFMVGCESGPSFVAFLTDTPTLVLNATDPISSYPLRSKDIFILKHIVERSSGRELTLRDLVSEEYLMNVRDSARFEFLDNSEDEILDAVKEMLALQAADVSLTPEQLEFKQLALKAALDFRPRSNYVRKWGAEGDFIGDGVISRSFAEKHLGAAPATPAGRSPRRVRAVRKGAIPA